MRSLAWLLVLLPLVGFAKDAPPNPADFPLTVKVLGYQEHTESGGGSVTNCRDTSIPGPYPKSVGCVTADGERSYRDTKIELGPTIYTGRCDCAAFQPGEYKARWKDKENLDVLSLDSKGVLKAYRFKIVGAALVPSSVTSPPEPLAGSFQKVYTDESRCLAGPEIRNDTDNPISCYCRDALVDVRYVYQTYIVTGKDNNLVGAGLALEQHAQQMCGDNSFLAAEKVEWKWTGPEIMRLYPPDAEIERIAPDAKGFRRVPYKVRLTFRDARGTVAKVEDYDATYLDGPPFNGRSGKR